MDGTGEAGQRVEVDVVQEPASEQKQYLLVIPMSIYTNYPTLEANITDRMGGGDGNESNVPETSQQWL